MSTESIKNTEHKNWTSGQQQIIYHIPLFLSIWYIFKSSNSKKVNMGLMFSRLASVLYYPFTTSKHMISLYYSTGNQEGRVMLYQETNKHSFFLSFQSSTVHRWLLTHSKQVVIVVFYGQFFFIYAAAFLSSIL